MGFDIGKFIWYWIGATLLTFPFYVFDQLTGYRKFGSPGFPKGISEVFGDFINRGDWLKLIVIGFFSAVFLYLAYGREKK